MKRKSVNAYTNAKLVIRNITNKIKSLSIYGETLVRNIAEELLLDIRKRLKDSGYDVEKLLKNIVIKEQGSSEEGTYTCKIGFADSISTQDRNIMYFLEFGTGIVGEDSPHPMANEVGWEYNKNQVAEDWASEYYAIPTGYNSLGEFVGFRGWWYVNPQTGNFEFTSGLKPIAYLYEATREENITKIVNKVFKRIKFK